MDRAGIDLTRPPVINLVLATGVAGAIAWRTLTRLSMTQGEYNV